MKIDSARLMKALKWILGIGIILFSVAPIYSSLLIALTPSVNVMEAQLYPKYWAFDNFSKAFRLIRPHLVNSFIYSIVTVLCTLAITIPPAYIIARYRFLFKKVLIFSILLTQMIAGIVLLPSLYQFFNRIHLINTSHGLVLTLIGLNLALTVWLLLGFFASLPREIEEAAIVEGAGFVTVLFRFVVPMAAPGIAVSAIFTFINAYNEFAAPLFLLTDAGKHPLTMRLYSFLSDVTIQWEMVGSSAIIGMIPPVLIFLFFQQYIIKGLTVGAVKS